MNWPAMQRFAEATGPDGQARLLRVLESPGEDRAALIGRLHLRDDGALLEELLIELEEKEWARQAAIEELLRQIGEPGRPGDSKPDDLVVDPFCGAGVTMVEAMLAGRNSVGIDVLSMARFISKVKTTPVDIPQEEAFAVADKAETLAAKKDGLREGLPPVYNIDYWFSEETQHQMAAILKVIGREKDGLTSRPAS